MHQDSPSSFWGLGVVDVVTIILHFISTGFFIIEGKAVKMKVTGQDPF